MRRLVASSWRITMSSLETLKSTLRYMLDLPPLSREWLNSTWLHTTKPMLEKSKRISPRLSNMSARTQIPLDHVVEVNCTSTLAEEFNKCYLAILSSSLEAATSQCLTKSPTPCSSHPLNKYHVMLREVLETTWACSNSKSSLHNNNNSNYPRVQQALWSNPQLWKNRLPWQTPRRSGWEEFDQFKLLHVWNLYFYQWCDTIYIIIIDIWS